MITCHHVIIKKASGKLFCHAAGLRNNEFCLHGLICLSSSICTRPYIQFHFLSSLLCHVCSGRATITGAHAVARHLCRLAAAGSTPSTSPQLYGSSSLEKAEVDHWLEYSLISLTKQGLADNKDVMSYLDGVLAPRVYLMGYELSLADLAVFGAMRGMLP